MDIRKHGLAAPRLNTLLACDRPSPAYAWSPAGFPGPAARDKAPF